MNILVSFANNFLSLSLIIFFFGRLFIHSFLYENRLVFSDEKTKDFLSLLQFLSICYYMLLLLFCIEVNFSLKRMQTLATRFSVDYDNNSNKNDNDNDYGSSDRNKLQTRLCKQNNV